MVSGQVDPCLWRWEVVAACLHGNRQDTGRSGSRTRIGLGTLRAVGRASAGRGMVPTDADKRHRQRQETTVQRSAEGRCSQYSEFM